MSPTRPAYRFDFASAQALSDHLREHPESAGQAPEKLAEEFRLPEPFVRELLSSLRQPHSRDEAVRKALLDFKAKFCDGWVRSVRLFDDATKQPVHFVFITTFLAAVVVLALGITMVRQPTSTAPTSVVRFDWPANILSAATLIAHFACYYRKGMVRYALYGGLAVLAVVWPASVVALLSSQQPLVPQTRLIAIAGISVAIVFATALYTGLAATASVVGGYSRIRRELSAEDSMDRQQLLEYLLGIRERLRHAQEHPTRLRPTRFEQWKAMVRTRPLVWSALGGLAFGLVAVSIVGVLTAGRPSGTESDGLALGLISVLLFFVSAALMSFLAFHSGGVRHGIVSALLFQVSSLLPQFLPVGAYGLERGAQEMFSWSILPELAFGCIVGFFAGLGARVEERAAHNRRLRRDDPAALFAELVRAQWRIAPRSNRVCVLVVDAARSAAMKAEADPLVAEWSFREYQKFIEAIVRRWDGTIHSTAGDGAVVAFSTPGEAFAAARAIQSEIDPFNRNVNRLRSPFRVRIGLHQGRIQGDLDEVEYTEVIDIAAHVQEIAPVGGIAMTEPVAKGLEGEKLAQLREEANGWPIYLALNPTGD